MLLVKQRLARLVPGWVTQGSCDGAVIGWVKQRLARLVPGWVTQGSCGSAVTGWVQVYYSLIKAKNIFICQKLSLTFTSSKPFEMTNQL